MEGKTCAIYIDGDNFMYKGVSELFHYIKKWNIKVLHKVVYGDFSEPSMLNWRDTCLDYNLTSIHLWKKHSKNSVDMKMSCDIQELLYTRNYNVDVFILCTGDRDFVPIIDKIHTQEKIVIGMSTNFFGTSSMFKNECDQFYSLCVMNHDNENNVVDKRKINKSYKEEDIKEEFHSIDLDSFFKNDNEYIQKLKNIIKNGKYVSVLKDIVKTPDEEQMIKKVIDDIHKKPKLVDEMKKVSKDVKEYVKMNIKEDKKDIKRGFKKSLKKEKKSEGSSKVVKVKEKKKTNISKNNVIKKDDFLRGATTFCSSIGGAKKVEKKQTHLFESDTIDEILNDIGFAYEVEEEKDYSIESIKKCIIDFLKSENKSVFVSQIKDVILKSYPKFSEKDYHFNGFTSFIKSFEPEIKTESKGVGLLYAYLS